MQPEDYESLRYHLTEQKKAKRVVMVLFVVTTLLLFFIVSYGIYGLTSLKSNVEAGITTPQELVGIVRNLFLAPATACVGAVFAIFIWARTIAGYINFAESKKQGKFGGVPPRIA